MVRGYVRVWVRCLKLDLYGYKILMVRVKVRRLELGWVRARF